jgi:hypothetical protein
MTGPPAGEDQRWRDADGQPAAASGLKNRTRSRMIPGCNR